MTRVTCTARRRDVFLFLPGGLAGKMEHQHRFWSQSHISPHTSTPSFATVHFQRFRPWIRGRSCGCDELERMTSDLKAEGLGLDASDSSLRESKAHRPDEALPNPTQGTFMPPLRSCPVPRRLGAILLFVVGRSLLLKKKRSAGAGWQGPWFRPTTAAGTRRL